MIKIVEYFGKKELDADDEHVIWYTSNRCTFDNPTIAILEKIGELKKSKYIRLLSNSLH